MPRKSKKWLYQVLEVFGPWIIRLLGYTLRVKRVNAAGVDKLFAEKQPFLLCVWHGRMLVPIFVHRNQGIIAMISQHADGEMVMRIVKKLGYGAVRGSSKRGGKAAFSDRLDKLSKGNVGAMLPDGPTGPRHHLKKGTLMLASQSGVPLVPITFAAKSCRQLNSWDRFLVPLPFTRCVVYYDEPIHVPADIPAEEIEPWRKKIEDVMINLVIAAERHLGRSGEDV